MASKEYTVQMTVGGVVMQAVTRHDNLEHASQVAYSLANQCNQPVQVLLTYNRANWGNVVATILPDQQ